MNESTPVVLGAVDSHCHLPFTPKDDEAFAILDRAREAGVVQVIDVGCWHQEDRRHHTVDRAEGLYPAVACTVGVHPHDASRADSATLKDVARLAQRRPVVAIGETGLDYHYNYSSREDQQAAFRRFIRLARDQGLPLVVHSRIADEDTRRILREENAQEVGGVIHCFTGGLDLALAALDMGFHIGFTGVITFKGESTDPIRQVAKTVPSDQLLVETDAPYLAPVPHRGRTNEPAFLVHTLAQLAHLRNDSLPEITATTAQNARRLFRLPSL